MGTVIDSWCEIWIKVLPLFVRQPGDDGGKVLNKEEAMFQKEGLFVRRAFLLRVKRTPAQLWGRKLEDEEGSTGTAPGSLRQDFLPDSGITGELHKGCRHDGHN